MRLWDMLPENTASTEPIITRYRSAAQNLRTTFEKIIRRAGLEPWPKLFQNLRSTRETELAETFPIHVVCVAGQHPSGRDEALPASHRGTLRPGSRIDTRKSGATRRSQQP